MLEQKEKIEKINNICERASILEIIEMATALIKIAFDKINDRSIREAIIKDIINIVKEDKKEDLLVTVACSTCGALFKIQKIYENSEIKLCDKHKGIIVNPSNKIH